MSLTPIVAADPPVSTDSKVWLTELSRGVAAWVWGAVFLGLAAAGAIIAQAYLIAVIVQLVVSGPSGVADLGDQFLLLLILVLGRGLLTTVREWFGFEAGCRVRRRLRQAVAAQWVALGPVHARTQESGALASLALEQVEALQNYFALYLPQRWLAGLIPLMIIAAVLPLNWAAATILVFTAPLIPLFMVIVGTGAANANQRQFQALSRMSAHFLDRLQGLATLKLLGQGQGQIEAIARVTDDYRQRTMQVLRLAFLSSTVLEFFSAVAIAMVAVYLGMTLLGQFQFGQWTPLDLQVALFILLLAPEFYLPLRQLGSHYHARAEAVAAAEALLTLLNTPTPAPVEKGQCLNLNQVILTFDEVYYGYDHGQRPALQGLSFRVAAGERVVVVGPSGAGKTTTVAMTLGFLRPDSGTVQVNGQALNTIDPKQWHRHVAWLGQQPVLFHGTVEDNILLGRSVSAGQLQRALEYAGVEEFLGRLPRGLATELGERGYGLSGGQAQRVGLARALLAEAPLVVLDEPTASLDLEQERVLLNGLEHLMAQRTVLIFTHRLEAIRRAGRILVMAEGRIVEQGDHASLLQHDGLYARLAHQGGVAVQALQEMP